MASENRPGDKPADPLPLGPPCNGCRKLTRIVSDPASHEPRRCKCVTKGCVYEGMEKPVPPEGGWPRGPGGSGHRPSSGRRR